MWEKNTSLPWQKICIKFNPLGVILEEPEVFAVWVMFSLVLVYCRYREYPESISLWHFAMCSAEGEKAAEASRIYWLNFTVINRSFTSDIKKMICFERRPWRSVNVDSLPAAVTRVLNYNSFDRLCFYAFMHNIELIRTNILKPLNCFFAQKHTVYSVFKHYSIRHYTNGLRAWSSSYICVHCFVCFVKTLDLETVYRESSRGLIISREKPYTKRPLSALHCYYSNNPYLLQNHPKAFISFLRLLWCEKYSCTACGKT